MKFSILVICFLFVLNANAQSLKLNLANESFAEFVSFIQAIENARTGSNTEERSLVIFPDTLGDGDAYKAAYKNGDMYYLIGDLDDNWTEKEWGRYYTIAKWLVKNSFRAIINPVAFSVDIKEAVQNPKTSGIIWSSHADKNGNIYDANQKPVAKNIFNTNKSANFKHLVLSNCSGDVTATVYNLKGITAHYWSGTTTTSDLFDYLISDNWNRDLENDLGIKL